MKRVTNGLNATIEVYILVNVIQLLTFLMISIVSIINEEEDDVGDTWYTYAEDFVQSTAN